jgi:pSer/pThr/pTyr-binding forkhead associated (FHA) protein
MPTLILTMLEGRTQSLAFTLKPGRNTLGRSGRNDVVLDSLFTSREHAAIVVEAAFTTLSDLGSQNGSFVNGERVETQVLVEGDVIQLGGCELRFVSDNQQFSEVEARGLASVPNWVADEGREHAPTVPDVPAGPRKISPS